MAARAVFFEKKKMRSCARVGFPDETDTKPPGKGRTGDEKLKRGGKNEKRGNGTGRLGRKKQGEVVK